MFLKEEIIMEGIQAGAAAAQTSSALKDIAGGQVVTKTLDKMNTAQTVSGPKMDADYQMRKDVLNAAGIGQKLDVEA